jgi:hypothetical protein
MWQHLVEEYARHNGHADLLRETIDGSAGLGAGLLYAIVSGKLRSYEQPLRRSAAYRPHPS